MVVLLIHQERLVDKLTYGNPPFEAISTNPAVVL